MCSKMGPKTYVGSTSDMDRRKWGHKNTIGCASRILIDEYGWDNIIFTVLEECTIERRHECEQYWIDFVPNTVNVIRAFASEETTKEQNKAYREAHKEAFKEINKAYREANREAVLEKQKAYREANRETLRERDKAHYEANREAIKEQKKAHYEANREAINEKRKARRASKKTAM